MGDTCWVGADRGMGAESVLCGHTWFQAGPKAICLGSFTPHSHPLVHIVVDSSDDRPGGHHRGQGRAPLLARQDVIHGQPQIMEYRKWVLTIPVGRLYETAIP